MIVFSLKGYYNSDTSIFWSQSAKDPVGLFIDAIHLIL